MYLSEIQRVYEYWPSQNKVILEGALMCASGKQLWGSDEIKVEPGESTYVIYPEDLIPR